MSHRIQITCGDLTLAASLYENETAHAIREALPLEGQAHRWGEEVYFAIPVQLPEAEDARQVMQVGELAYWPAGAAFCIFFGPTPVSEDNRPRAFSKVNPFGRVQGDAHRLRSVQEGERVLVHSLAEHPTPR